MKANLFVFFFLLIIIIPYYFIQYDSKTQNDLDNISIDSSSLSLEFDRIAIHIIASSQFDTLPIRFEIKDSRNIIQSSADSPIFWIKNSESGKFSANLAKKITFEFNISRSISIPTEFILSLFIGKNVKEFTIKPITDNIYKVGSVLEGIEIYEILLTKETVFKGENFGIKLILFNWNTYNTSTLGINFQFTSFTYEELYYFVFPQFLNTNVQIPAFNSECKCPGIQILQIELPLFGNDGKGNAFAFNSGNWSLSNIILDENSTLRTFETNLDFPIFTKPGSHPVFIVHFRDSTFIETVNSSGYFNRLENQLLSYNEEKFTLKEKFGIDFSEIDFNFSATSPDIQDMLDRLSEDAKNNLGLDKWSSNWGTSKKNHGFDLLVGSAAIQNIVDANEQNYGGLTSLNKIVMMSGWTSESHFPFNVNYDDETYLRTHLHEIFHAYQANHIEEVNYLMYFSAILSGWRLHPDTYATFIENLSFFDGFK